MAQSVSMVPSFMPSDDALRDVADIRDYLQRCLSECLDARGSVLLQLFCLHLFDSAISYDLHCRETGSTRSEDCQDWFMRGEPQSESWMKRLFVNHILPPLGWDNSTAFEDFCSDAAPRELMLQFNTLIHEQVSLRRRQLDHAILEHGILALPTEILAYIVELAYLEGPWAPIRASAVCRRFRSVTISHGRLWTHLCNTQRPEWVDLQIMRSANCDLVIVIDTCFTGWGNEKCSCQCLTFTQRIVQESHRWRKFSFNDCDFVDHVASLDSGIRPTLANLQLPRLRTLDVRSADQSHYETWSMPKLAKIRCTPDIFKFPMRLKLECNLRSLKFELTEDEEDMPQIEAIDRLFRFLQLPALSQIENLKLLLQSVGQMAQEDGLWITSTLEKLRYIKFDIYWSDFNEVHLNIIKHLHLPNVECIHFVATLNSPESKDQSFEDLYTCAHFALFDWLGEQRWTDLREIRFTFYGEDEWDFDAVEIRDFIRCCSMSGWHRQVSAETWKRSRGLPTFPLFTVE